MSRSAAINANGLLPFYLRELPFDQIEAAWAREIPDEDDHDAVRRVIFVDRFYLMANIFIGWGHCWHPWVYARCREVERDPYNRMDLWARWHFKSSIITVAGTVQAILRDPDSTSVIYSHSAKEAKDMFLQPLMRELERNQRLKDLFPEILYEYPQDEAPRWSRDGGIIVKRTSNKKEATVEAHSILDLPTGKHFDQAVYDDVVTMASVTTEDQIQTTIEMFSNSRYTLSLEPRARYCGTRYSYQDPYADLIERGALRLRQYPATADGTIHGEPVFFTREVWEEKKAGLPNDVACQLLLSPQSAGQRHFDLNQVLRYEVRPRYLVVYILIDPAHSKRKGADETAMVVVGVSLGQHFYVLEVICHRMALDERYRRMRDLREKYSPENMSGISICHVYYESWGAKTDAQALKLMMELDGLNFDINPLEFPASGAASKNDRILRLQLAINEMKLHFPYRDRSGRGLTGKQLRAKALGEAELISGFSKPNHYKVLDEEGRPYDALMKLELQLDSYPYVRHDDAIDALARIYDCDIRVPMHYDEGDLEPEWT